VAELYPLIRDEGYPLALNEAEGLIGGKVMLDGVLRYPMYNGRPGADSLVYNGRDFKADIVLTFQDLLSLNPSDLQKVQNWIPCACVDYDPASPVMLSNLRFAKRVITPSKHGQQALARYGMSARYIPNSINTDIYAPGDTLEQKRRQGFPPDTFIVGVVAGNYTYPSRKAFQEMVDAFKLFSEAISPAPALLYLHTDPFWSGGFPDC